MAYQAIGLGTTEGDGTGDSIRDGGDKVNDNFVEIYTLLGTGTALSSGISATATVVTLTSPVISGVLALGDGSASAPSLTNDGDTNTGIYFSASDTVSVTTGGTKRLDIDSTGLDVTGAITATTTIQGTTITATTAFVADAQDGAALGTTSLQFSDLFLADGAVIALGDDGEVTLTHVHNTGLLLSDASGIGTTQLQFGDSGTYIHQSADGVLDLVADTEIEINATTVDINGAVDVSGILTTGDEPDLHGGGLLIDASAASTDEGEELLLDRTDGSGSNAGDKVLLEYATQFTNSVLFIKNSGGVVINTFGGVGGAG